MVGSLCDWLVEHRLPLFIWHVELRLAFACARWPEAFPQLNIIVETQTQKILYHSRPLFALMRDCPNRAGRDFQLRGGGLARICRARIRGRSV